MLNRYPTLIAVAALSCVHGAAADTIYLTDGTAIEDVGVQSEHLDQVAYKAGKKSTSVDADKVLFIEFSSKPQLVDSADANVAEDLLLDALDDLSNFLDGLEASPRKWPWSRPYALFRLLEVHETLGELDKLVETADRLAELEPDSRYVPLAQLRKAQALYDSGKPEPAKASLAVFGRYIDDKGLSDRWRLGKELSEVLFDDASTGSARVARLESISERAGVVYPVERNRAEVALGEESLRAHDIKGAREIFEGIAADPNADSRTLAAAYLGLADCYWVAGEARSAEDSGKEDLKAALTAYMRVVVVYKAEQRYVPKAMFFSGRCFQLIGGEGAEEKATKIYDKLIRYYRESKWAREAKGFRNT